MLEGKSHLPCRGLEARARGLLGSQMSKPRYREVKQLSQFQELKANRCDGSWPHLSALGLDLRGV